jgi:methyl-accepting chemotaxis protein
VGSTLIVLVAASLVMLTYMHRTMVNARITELRAILEQQVEKGDLSRDAAMAEFSRFARSFVYDHGQGYIFAFTMDGVTIALPDPTQIGVNRLDVLVGGWPVIRQIRDAVRQTGSAEIEYDFTRPGTTIAVPKLSHAAVFPAWNMFIGTGVYIDDLEAEIATLRFRILLGVAGIAMSLALLAWVISRRITAPIGGLQVTRGNQPGGCRKAMVQVHHRFTSVGEATERFVLRPYDSNLGGDGYPRCDAG